MQSITITIGPCARCGADTELFLGRAYCDACIEAIMSEREQSSASAMAEERLNVAIKRCALSPECKNVSWFKSEQTPELIAVREWAAQDAMSTLWLYSASPGTGKTHAARCAIREACESGSDAAEISVRKAVRLGTSNYSESRFDFAALSMRELLLLDDVDKVSPSPQGIEALWELVDERRSRRHKTIYTANCTPGEWVNSLGGGAMAHSLADRLKPMNILGFPGGSRR